MMRWGAGRVKRGIIERHAGSAMTGNAMTGSATTGDATTGLRWSHLFFLLSTWAVVSIVALLVVGLAWTLRLKPQALQDARAQRQDIVRVLAGLADAQLRDKLAVLGPLAAHFAQGWASREPRALQREIDTMRAMLQMPTLFVVSPDGRPLVFSPLTGPDGTSNLELRYADRPLLQEAIRVQGPAVSGIIFGRASRDFVVGAAVPIKVDQQIVAYLIGSIRLQGSIEALEQAGPGGWLIMIDPAKQAIYLDRQTRQLTQEDWKDHPFVAELNRRRTDGLASLGEEEWLLTRAVMPTLKVDLVFAASVRQILENQRAVLLTLVATLLVSVAMSLAVSTVTAVRFVREQQAAALRTRTRRWWDPTTRRSGGTCCGSRRGGATPMISRRRPFSARSGRIAPCHRARMCARGSSRLPRTSAATTSGPRRGVDGPMRRRHWRWGRTRRIEPTGRCWPTRHASDWS